jgi:hypothetical protein
MTIVNYCVLLLNTFAIIWLFLKRPKTQAGIVVPPVNTPPIQNSLRTVYWSLGIAGVFSIVSLLAPVLLTQKAFWNGFNFAETGQIGDTIGGLTSPFLGIAGIILTFLAFYMQYEANQLQREQFIQEQAQNKKDLQDQIDHQNTQTQVAQFESQFYEMLKLHRDNIGEMQITGYDFVETDTVLQSFEKVTEGRKVFVTMKTELESILGIYSLVKGSMNDEGFEDCYEIFFGGIEEYLRRYPAEAQSEFIKALKAARKQHEFPDHMHTRDNQKRKNYKGVTLYFNYKPFSGHASRLGHYFRHLYLTVKSVANSRVITDYAERMRYLAILRAQLSNHEQILLFYNWLSGYGGDWENNKHAFLTDYKMIHNLWHDTLFYDDYINAKVDFLRNKPTVHRTGKMFEIDKK